jgi:homocysteine S-methyltransferase
MGTELYQRGGFSFDRCLDELNLSQPDLIKSVHLDYIRAGAEIIETNTFGANRVRLSGHGLEGRVQEINAQAVALAKEASRLSGQKVWIAGSVGPLGKPLAPLGTFSEAYAREIFREQVESLAGADVSLIILETFASVKEITEAILAAREVCDLPLVAQMTFSEDGKTTFGDTPTSIVERLMTLGVQAVGANCSVGAYSMLQVIEEMSRAGDLHLAAQPNAGFPDFIGRRFVYRSSPEYMAEQAGRMVELGVSIVGGCCGTTPGHIAAIRNAIRKVSPPAPRPKSRVARTGAKEATIFPAPHVRESTELSQKLGRKFVVTVEMDPPKGFDISGHLSVVADLKSFRLVDAINVADSPRAQGRMSALAMCTLIQTRMGRETILHLATRHRNLVALHSELLGAHALGVRNIFAVMGDPPRIGDYPDATAVSDITASGLLRLIKSFNEGVDLTGKPIERPTSFFVGCAFNMGATDLDRELKVLEKKLEAGADFILTQPVYSVEVVERCWKRLGGFPAPVIMGLLPLRSLRHAEFLSNEVPGVMIPEDVRQQMRDAGKKGPEAGVALARELLKGVRDKIGGVYFIPPFEHYEVVEEVLAPLSDLLAGSHVSEAENSG